MRTMRPIVLAIAFLAPITISSSLPEEPFLTPLDTSDLITANITFTNILDIFLQKRSNCPTNYDSCSTFAAADKGACCTSGSTCTADSAHNIACCPTGAKCTGTLSYASTTDTAVIIGGSTTTTNVFSTTASTSTTGLASTTATGTASFVYNTYFPFPYIPTSYVNAAACTSAYSICGTNYAVCTADLQGGNYAVTIDSPNGGITVAAATGTFSLPASSAASICSSLSQEACFGLQTSNCAQFGTASETTTTTSTSAVGTFIVGNAAARQTGILGAVGVGVLGVVGQFV